eukprot:1160682-Pelagomonas_calceolata.AAC.7
MQSRRKLTLQKTYTDCTHEKRPARSLLYAKVDTNCLHSAQQSITNVTTTLCALVGPTQLLSHDPSLTLQQSHNVFIVLHQLPVQVPASMKPLTEPVESNRKLHVSQQLTLLSPPTSYIIKLVQCNLLLPKPIPFSAPLARTCSRATALEADTSLDYKPVSPTIFRCRTCSRATMSCTCQPSEGPPLPISAGTFGIGGAAAAADPLLISAHEFACGRTAATRIKAGCGFDQAAAAAVVEGPCTCWTLAGPGALPWGRSGLAAAAAAAPAAADSQVYIPKWDGGDGAGGPALPAWVHVGVLAACCVAAAAAAAAAAQPASLPGLAAIWPRSRCCVCPAPHVAALA